MISNHKSRVDSFIGQISSGSKPFEVVKSISFDAQFSVIVTYKVKAFIEKIEASALKGSIRHHINGREAFDQFLENEKQAKNFISNSLLINSSRVSNYGSITNEVKSSEETYISYTEVCGNCSGIGKVTCNHCHGKKVMVCAKCNGAGCKHCRMLGQVRCGHCDDSGMNDCPVCLNKKSVEELYKIELKIKAEYQSDFEDGVNTKVIETINSFGRLDQLRSKEVAYVNSSSNLYIDEDDGNIKIRYYMSCPINVINIKLVDKVEEIVLYGISQKIIDLSGVSERILRLEEQKLYQMISDTKLVGGSYDELIASVNDYASIAIHKKIIMARNNLIKREIKPTASLIKEELENTLSEDYINKFLQNVEGAIKLASMCVKATYILPALAAYPFLYAVIGIWLDDPVSFVVSVLIVIAGYFYTSLIFDSIIKKNGGDAITMMRIPTI